MKKKLSILTVVLILSGVVVSQPINKLENQASGIPEKFEVEDVVNFIDVTTSSVTYGPEAVFNYDHTWYLDVAVLDANHFVVVYGDWGNSRVGKAVIGTLSGSSITYGNTYLFNAGSTYKPRVASLDSTHFVISFGDSIGQFTYNETLMAGSVAGNVITYGNPVVFTTTYGYFDSPVSGLGTNSFVVAYWDSGDSYNRKAIVGTLSGLNITLGSPCLFNNYSPPPVGYSYGRASLTSLDSSTIAITYSITDDSVRTVATIGFVSGNTITFGSEYIFKTGVAEKLSITTLDSNRFVIAYVDQLNTHHGTAIVGNVSGNSILYGQEYEFYPDWTMYVSASALDNTHFAVLYFNSENVHSGASKIGTVVENTIYFDDEITYNPAYSFWQTVDCFNENRYVIAYGDEVNGTHPHLGTSIIGVISQYPAITKIRSDTICPINSAIPIITEYIEDVIEFTLTLHYDTIFQTYQGYQNSNSLLEAGSLSVIENSGQIDITWNSTSSIYISSDTLMELLFDNIVPLSQSTSSLIWDTNSYYKNSQGTIAESIFHDGQIVTRPIPIDAYTIIGDSIACQGSNDESYQTCQITNATAYNWGIIPDSAGTIIGTDTVVVIDFSPTYSGIATLTVYGSNSCGDGASFSWIIEITEIPTVNAGSDNEICQDESYLLSGEAFCYSSVFWTTSGDGMFDDPSLLGATYFPGSLDVINNTVDLTLTAIPDYPCINNIADQMKLDIGSFPEQPVTPDGPITIDLGVTQTSEYTTSPAANTASYNWILYPSEAGIIESNDTVGTVFWESSYVGIYAYVYVDASNDCGETNSDSLGISLSPVYVKHNSSSDIIVYPNPTEDYFSINLGSKTVKEINIYNHFHERVFNTTAFMGIVDISKLGTGIYFIEIKTNDKEYRQKIIKK